jgi:rifampicin phosphotransferase
MFLRANPDFSEIEWPDPTDAELSWSHDNNHAPTPVPALAADFIFAWMARAFGGRAVTINGYLYWGPDVVPHPQDLGVPAVQYWRDNFPTRAQDVCARIRKPRHHSSPAAALTTLDEAVEQSSETFKFTMDTAGGLMVPLYRLTRFCSKLVGGEGALDAMTVLTGDANPTLDSAASLERLAELAEQDTELASLVRQCDLAGVRANSSYSAFTTAFDAYLELFGGRCRNWFDIHRPTWTEEPEVPLGIVAKYLEAPEQRPSAAFARASAARFETLARIHGALKEPAERAKFEQLTGALDGAVYVKEARALWQMLTFAALRIPALALGRLLVADGTMLEPSDVFYFSRAELRQLSERKPSFEPIPTALARRAELAEWQQLRAPLAVGKPGSEVPSAVSTPVDGIEELRKLAGERPRVVSGVGAGRGVATGRACVARTLQEAQETVRTGDILICPNTSPPWTPLFAVIAGVVSDSGGMLSHGAINAREYGIPAIMATGHGTRDIPNGATVTIDGAAGTVTINP